MALRSTDLFLVGRGVASYKFSAESLGDYYRSSFVPLSGTLEGAPITGDIEFQNGKKILFGSDGNGLTIKDGYWGGLFYGEDLQLEFGVNGLKVSTDIQMKIGTPGDAYSRNRITYLGDPQHMYDAATKKYVDDKYDELDLDNIQLDSYLPLAGGVMSGLLVNEEISVGPYPTTRLEELAEPLSASDQIPTLYLNTGTLTADPEGLGSDLNDLAGWYLDVAEKPNDAQPYSITRVEFDGEESPTGYAYIYHHRYDSPDYYYSFELDDDVRDWTKVTGTDVRGNASRLYGIISTRLNDGTVRYLSMTNKGFSWKDNDFRGDGWTQSTGGSTNSSSVAAVNGLLAIGCGNSANGSFSSDGGTTANSITFPSNVRPCTPLAYEDGFLFNETYLSGGSKNKLWYTENGTDFTSVDFSSIVADSNLGLTESITTGSGCAVAKVGDYYLVPLNRRNVARSKTPLDTSTYELLPKFTKGDLYNINVIDENLIILNFWSTNYHPLAVVNGDWENLQEFDFLIGYSPKGSYNYLDFVSDDNEAVMLFSGNRLVRYRNDNFSFSGTGEQHIYWNNEQLATVADLRSVLNYAKDEFNKDDSEIAQKLEDAPSDGETYVRKDGEWVQEEPFDDSHLLPLSGGTVTGEIKFNRIPPTDLAFTVQSGRIELKSDVTFDALNGNFTFRGGSQTDGDQNHITILTGSGTTLFDIKRGYNLSLSGVEYNGNIDTDKSIVTKKYVDDKIEDLGDVLTFKGAVDFTVTTAPTSPSVGDVYANNVDGTPHASWGLNDDVASGELYGRGENGWALIGGAEIDLTGYATETYVNVQTALRTPLNLGSLPELPTP